MTTSKLALEQPRVLPSALSQASLKSLNSSNQRPFQAKDLRNILSKPEGRDAILEHLSDQCSTENLLFWESINRFKSLAQQVNASASSEWPQSLVDEAVEIYCDYIQTGGNYEVNLPASIKSDLEEKFAILSEKEECRQLTEKDVSLNEKQQNPPARWSWLQTGIKPHSRYSVALASSADDMRADLVHMFDNAQQHALMLMLENNKSFIRDIETGVCGSPQIINGDVTVNGIYAENTGTTTSFSGNLSRSRSAKKALIAALSPSTSKSPSDATRRSPKLGKSNNVTILRAATRTKLETPTVLEELELSPGPIKHKSKKIMKEGSQELLQKATEARRSVYDMPRALSKGSEELVTTIAPGTTDQFETSLLVLFRKRINDGMTFKPIYEQLLKAAKGGTNILQSGDAVSQTSQISDIILVKFLRAKDFDVERAYKCLKQYCRWYALHSNGQRISVRQIEDVLYSQLILIDTGGIDNRGLRIVYMRPNAYIPKLLPYARIIMNLMFVLERVIQEPEVQQRGITFICDMRDWSWDNYEGQYAYNFFQTIQFIFPVFIAKFVLVDPPSWFSKVWTIIRPMMTREFASRWELRSRDQLSTVADDWNLTDDLGGKIRIDVSQYVESCLERESSV